MAHAELAVRRRATLRTGETIRSWRFDGSGVVVETDQDSYQAERLIVTAGSWAGQLLAELGIPLEGGRKPLYWFRTTADAIVRESGCPGFLFDLPHGCFYGVPQIDAQGVKVAEHTGGAIVNDPLAVDRGVDSADQQRVSTFVGEYLPAATTQCTNHTVCMYTMTPYVDFVVDRHPQQPAVSFAAGLSGHGFKFTGVLGECLASWRSTVTPLPIGFLSSTRFSLRAVMRSSAMLPALTPRPYVCWALCRRA